MHWSCLRNPSLRMTRPFDLRKRFSSVLNSLSLSLSSSLSLCLTFSLCLCLWYEQQRMHKSGDISVTSKFCLQNFFSLDERTWKKSPKGSKKHKNKFISDWFPVVAVFSGHVSIFLHPGHCSNIVLKVKRYFSTICKYEIFFLGNMSSWAVWGETSLVVAALAQDAGLA